MKFSEIPKFTRTANYHIDVGLEYLEKYINDQIKELKLQLCPDFQRGHVWTQEQQIAYVEYLLQGGKSGRDIYMNITNMSTWTGEFVLVDGLQRITACLAFLHNEIPVFGTYYNQFEDRLRMAGIGLSININDLKTKKEVLKWYLEMNSGGTPHTKEELDRVKNMLKEEI